MGVKARGPGNLTTASKEASESRFASNQVSTCHEVLLGCPAQADRGLGLRAGPRPQPLWAFQGPPLLGFPYNL